MNQPPFFVDSSMRFIFTLLTILLVVAASNADDDGPSNQNQPTSLDDQLFEDLDQTAAPPPVRRNEFRLNDSANQATAAGSPDRERVHSIYIKMLDARTRLMSLKADTETLRRQQQILDELRDLVGEQNAPRSNGTLANDLSDETTGAPAAAPPRAGSPPAEDGSVPPSTSPQGLMEQVWGHLPANVRQALQSAGEEQFLPMYRDKIEAYYRALAHDPPDRSGGSRTN